MSPNEMTREQVEQQVRALGRWFHNLDLKGVQTAPNHFLGDFPRSFWKHFEDAIPRDLSGKSVLDIGCNGGFYSIEMKRRGAARVVGIDVDEAYLAQARFATRVCGVEVELHRMSVYQVAELQERFDLVLFMGVLYHLRHPLLALDLLHEHVVKDTLVFQTLERGSEQVDPVPENAPFTETGHFEQPGYPRMHFIEHRYADDETNWWVPNRACSEAMLRSSGFEVLGRPATGVYVCRSKPLTVPSGAVYPSKPAQGAESWLKR
jgi:tRNA (mo5U34)-methyltransferase